ncbi:MAG: UvrD-helicase domain-containing protein [Polyangiales bacterium]
MTARSPEQRVSAQGLRIIGASAGSGKTHQLTAEVVAAVRAGAERPARVEGLVAVTYTRKGHTELASRIRRTLIKDGSLDRAQRLPLAYLGTVHAVALRLVREFAFDAGLSPELAMITAGGGRLLGEALEATLDAETSERITALARSLQIGFDQITKRVSWRPMVSKVMELARSNRIAPTSLSAMSERSTARLLSFFRPALSDGTALDVRLRSALATAIAGVASTTDGQKNTAECLALLREMNTRDRSDGLLWSDWVKLAALGEPKNGKRPGKTAVHFVDPLAEVASDYDRHPRLHAEVREFTAGIYGAAERALSTYAEWKARRRVADYVDLLDHALTLVETPCVAEELSQRLDLVVVDEFQDTSPVQLALFVGLHRIAKRSIWVGDRKQCIFEFAEADPALMDSVTRWAIREGGESTQLPKNWRSRPELVDACSKLFTHALAPHGFSESEIAVAATRTTPPRLGELPPFGCLWFESTNAAGDTSALAEGIRKLLSEPHATAVVDRDTGEVRDLRASDVAVLLAVNDALVGLAEALKARGIRVSIARRGLFDQPEGTLVDAALRFLLDSRDTLSVAVLEALTGVVGKDPDAWLDRLLAVERAKAEPKVEPISGDHELRVEASAPNAEPAWKAALGALRDHLAVFSPSEAVDAVIGALDAPRLCARWPDPEQRLGNLEAIRAVAAGYEERCVEEREAATLAGLLRCFEQATEGKANESTSDAQCIPTSADAVTLSTFHAAKGLEWPVVVVGALERKPRRDAFDIVPETDRAEFDPNDPLGGRWIRYWPWPFGLLGRAPLADAAEASPEGRAVAQRERLERARLAYVALTRARDHLIFATRVTKAGPTTTWLDELADANGEPILTFPSDASAGPTIGVRSADGLVTKFRARVWRLQPTDAPEDVASADRHAWPERPVDAAPSRPRYGIAPSRAADDWSGIAAWKPGAIVSLGHRLPIASDRAIAWNVVGDTVHAFFAADVHGLLHEKRLACAQRLLVASGVVSMLKPESLLAASDALRVALDARYPGATWRREVPVTAWIATPDGERRVDGAIDLLLETEAGVVIVDHKTFPGGGDERLLEKAAEFGAQVAAYARALEAAGKRVVGAWVHFAVVGAIVELTR